MTSLKKDITTRKDIEFLIDTFYSKVIQNSIIGPIFTDIAKIDLSKHLEIMYSFWSSLLLGEDSYKGNPMQKHIQLSYLTEMNEVHFNTWLQLFSETVLEYFEGDKAFEAIQRANNISTLMQFKINNKN